jgi:phospholipid/cholesterol/gamma-HCH transport system substrate-binding protein
MTQKFEAFVGLCVVLLAVTFLLMLAQINAFSFIDKSYSVKAYFNNISGISAGSDVKMSGVKIGTVQATNLNPQDFHRAELVLSIDNTIQLPIDSTIKITSDSLLGGSFVSIEAGFEKEVVKPNEIFENTQSSVNFMDLIAKAIFSAGGK